MATDDTSLPLPGNVACRFFLCFIQRKTRGMYSTAIMVEQVIRGASHLAKKKVTVEPPALRKG
eukprot:scaffold26118_cov29-Tisochrysis_lutea.AAC.6